MMLPLGLLMAAASLMLAGCVAPPRSSSYPSYTPAYKASTRPVPDPTNIHEYTVRAVDTSGRAVAGVAVILKLDSRGRKQQAASCTTDEQGRCPPVFFEALLDPSYVGSYSSTGEARGSKDGFIAGVASGASDVGSAGSTKKGDITLRMIRPTDYLADNLANSPDDKELRERVVRFLDVLRLQGILVDAELMLKGVGTTEFKGKKYLTVKVNSTTVYNSLKMNKYDIGKRLFDESVRKILTPLNDAIAAPRAYFGYDLVIYGHSRSFAERYSSADKHEFRFLMPEAVVRKYKNKDISGQALLDASVLLLDDERIDMRLQ